MATDLKPGRRRTISSAGSLRNGHARGQSRQISQPKSSHTSDEFLQDFLSPSFDPAAFLNASLPPLQHKSAPSPSSHTSSEAPVPLSELSSQAQTLLTQLNAHTTRLSNTLTQLTDDILRSGSRLAYEVELLRGETLSLEETLSEKLQEDIKKFVPEGVQEGSADTKSVPPTPTLAVEKENGEQQAQAQAQAPPPTPGNIPDSSVQQSNPNDPAFIQQLQTLTLVRSRLESVIKTFGDAMEFVFPPSELSVSSSFLSVSAPDPGSQQQSSEEKGQQVLQQLRSEVSSLMDKADDPVEGIEKAAQRIEELKELTGVWKGTAEEKGRNKFIESLAKTVEDRHRELMKEMELAAKRDGSAGNGGANGGGGRARKGSVTRDGAPQGEEAKSLPGGFGLISQLQRLRSGL